MLKLNLPTGPEVWTLLKGRKAVKGNKPEFSVPAVDPITISMRPLGSAIFEMAHEELKKITARALQGKDIFPGIPFNASSVPDIATNEGLDAFNRLFFYVSVATSGIEAWEGIAGDDGKLAPVNQTNISILFLTQPRIYEAFKREYAQRWGLLQLEGNVSGASPNGRSVAVPPTARVAGISKRLAQIEAGERKRIPKVTVQNKSALSKKTRSKQKKASLPGA